MAAMRLRAFAAALLASAVAGCAPRIESLSNPAYTGSPSSMLVVEKLGTDLSAFTRNGFKEGLSQAVGACRIALTFHDMDPLSLENGGDDGAIVASVIERAKPDAVMLIRPTRIFIGTYENTVRYTARLYDVATKRLVWRGGFVLSSGLTSFEASSQKVATDLVGAMARGGTLKSCPSAT